MHSPAFGDAALKGTIDSFPFAGADSDLTDSERFARGVAQVVSSWLKSHAGSAGSHAVFLMQPTPPEAMNELEMEIFYALDDGETDVTSGLWFVGPPVIQGSRYDSADTFDGMFPQVVGAGLGSCAAVTYRHTTEGAVLRYYPQGLGAPENRVRMTLADSAVELDQVFEIIDRVHSVTLVTPSGHQGGTKLWKTPSKWYPARSVEVAIQAYLRLGLSVGLPLCRINQEQNLVTGRLDLEVEELAPATSTVARHAVLELKVLRSYGSTGVSTSQATTEKWISDGVDQAYAYQEERSARFGALCCFDMRTDVTEDSCVQKAQSKADELGVAVRVWPIYPNAKNYRSAIASGALSTGSQPTTT